MTGALSALSALGESCLTHVAAGLLDEGASRPPFSPAAFTQVVTPASTTNHCM